MFQEDIQKDWSYRVDSKIEMHKSVISIIRKCIRIARSRIFLAAKLLGKSLMSVVHIYNNSILNVREGVDIRIKLY